MKICLAQTQSSIGDIATNICRHKALIELAAPEHVDIIIFPELSLTGYEPELAEKLATTKDDPRFDLLQQASDLHHMIIGTGAPLRTPSGVSVSMVLFFPGLPREVYTKNYLHEDEEPWFVSGESTVTTLGAANEIALAICYEISVAAHAEEACHDQTQVYLSSVAKTASGVDKAATHLSSLAKERGIVTMMSNCIGPCEGQEAGGKTGVWNSRGELVAQLDNQQEGLIMFDTNTNQAIGIYP